MRITNNSNGNRNLDDLVLATIETDEVQQVTDEDDVSNYTFTATAEEPGPGVSLINYIVAEDGNGGLYSYIIQYVPDETWILANETFFDMETYTGSLHFYTSEGLYVSTTSLTDGAVISFVTRDPCQSGGTSGGSGNTSGGGGTGNGTGNGNQGGGGTQSGQTGTTGNTGGGSTGGGAGNSVVCTCLGHPWGTPDCTCATYVIIVTTDFGIDPTAMEYLQRGPCGTTVGDPCQRTSSNSCGNPTIAVKPNINPINSAIEDNIIIDSLDPCSTYVVNLLKILDQNDISRILQRFGTPSSIYDWEIKTAVPPINPNNAAETDWRRNAAGNPIDFEYITYLKPTYRNQATKIAIARTLLHEMLHTYLLSLIDDYTINNNLGITDFPVLFNTIVNHTYGNNPELWQHEAISRKFIHPIRDALMEWDGQAQDIQYYEDLAWGALVGTISFNALFPPGSANRARIINTNAAEDTNSNQGGIAPKGNPC